MNIAAVIAPEDHMLPALDRFAIEAWTNQGADVVETGRAHFRDAVSPTAGHGWSGRAAQVRDAMENVRRLLDGRYRLA